MPGVICKLTKSRATSKQGSKALDVQGKRPASTITISIATHSDSVSSSRAIWAKAHSAEASNIYTTYIYIYVYLYVLTLWILLGCFSFFQTLNSKHLTSRNLASEFPCCASQLEPQIATF